MFLSGIVVFSACAVDGSGVGQHHQAITDGYADDGTFSAVGLLQAGITGSVGICTGTLIGRRTVLTAAHCVEPGKKHVFHLDGLRLAVQRVFQHEQWNPKDPQFPNDIGLAILEQSPGVAPEAIGTFPPEMGLRVTLVGFGATAQGSDDAGTRRVATNEISQVTGRRLAYAGTGDGRGSTCNGDSGGPAFATIDGRRYQVGITSAGVAPCGTLAWDTRVDIFRDWIMARAEGDVHRHDEQPPLVVITSPRTGDTTPSSVVVTADATDGAGVEQVMVRVAGREVARRARPPYRFELTLAPGLQRIAVVARDVSGNEAVASVHVSVERGLEPGGFGTGCRSAADCSSGICADSDELDGRAGDSFCSVGCRDDADCPAGASCGVTAAGSICLPAVLLSGEASLLHQDLGQPVGGCSLASGASGQAAANAPLLLSLLWLALIARRRR